MGSENVIKELVKIIREEEFNALLQENNIKAGRDKFTGSVKHNEHSTTYTIINKFDPIDDGVGK